MIYLNNAATTYPKPASVIEAQTQALSSPPAGQYRSADLLFGKDVFTLCRENLGKVLGIADTDRLFFASGATDALNRLIGGLDLRGCRVVATQTEHNSVLRPLYNDVRLQGSVEIIPCDACGRVRPEDVERYLSASAKAFDPTGNSTVNTSRKSPGLFILNHCSNVTGTLQDVAAISAIVHRYGFLLLLDVAQSAGCLPVCANDWQVDMLAFTGHKSLFGPQGTGGYYISRPADPATEASEKLLASFRPVAFGGTGRDSRQLTYENGDYEYEVGTQNAVGIAALNAGVEYILKKGVAQIHQEESVKMAFLYEALSVMPSVLLYGCKEDLGGPLLSFNIKGMAPSDVAYILQSTYDITLRTGLHCAPLIHQAMVTYPNGTLRVSISDLTPQADLDCFVQAVREIVAGL